MAKLLLAGLIAAVAVPAFAQVAPPMAPMMNEDRVMTRADVQGRVAGMFARLDANRDGVVLKAEANAPHQGMGDRRQRGDRQKMGKMHRDPAAAFARMDVDRDNMISRDEVTRAHAQRADRTAGKRDHAMGGMRGKGGMGGMGLRGMMFDRADANRDGRVTLAEAQTQAFAHFDMMDANRDGRLTRDERQNARRHMGMTKGS